MKKLWNVVIMLALVVSTPCLAQTQKGALPSKPSTAGPSLEATMKFIQDRMNGVGKVTYAVYVHDSANGSDWTNTNSIEDSNVVADPAMCRISFHWKLTNNGQVTQEKDIWFNLQAVEDLIVRTGDQDMKFGDVKAGHATWSARADPPFFVLVARQPGNSLYEMTFQDEDLTNRVAKAIVHAVELCGGGNKDPF